jgi:hypothetical protein
LEGSKFQYYTALSVLSAAFILGDLVTADVMMSVPEQTVSPQEKVVVSSILLAQDVDAVQRPTSPSLSSLTGLVDSREDALAPIEVVTDISKSNTLEVNSNGINLESTALSEPFKPS